MAGWLLHSHLQRYCVSCLYANTEPFDLVIPVGDISPPILYKRGSRAPTCCDLWPNKLDHQNHPMVLCRLVITAFPLTPNNLSKTAICSSSMEISLRKTMDHMTWPRWRSRVTEPGATNHMMWPWHSMMSPCPVATAARRTGFEGEVPHSPTSLILVAHPLVFSSFVVKNDIYSITAIPTVLKPSESYYQLSPSLEPSWSYPGVGGWREVIVFVRRIRQEPLLWEGRSEAAR